MVTHICVGGIRVVWRSGSGSASPVRPKYPPMITIAILTARGNLNSANGAILGYDKANRLASLKILN